MMQGLRNPKFGIQFCNNFSFHCFKLQTDSLNYESNMGAVTYSPQPNARKTEVCGMKVTALGW